MEIINLLLITIGYQLVYGYHFYIKSLILFCMSMFASMLINHKYFEIKSKEENKSFMTKFMYLTLFSIIQLVFLIYNLSNTFLEKLLEIKGVNNIYQVLVKVNDHFIIGRNRIMMNMSQMVFTVVVPKNGLMNMMLQSRLPPQNNEITEEKKNVFTNEEEMKFFLDDLVNKKDD